MSLTLALTLIAVAFIFGFGTAQMGTWFRGVQLEGRFRGLRNRLYDYAAMSGSDTLPKELVLGELDDFITREYR